MTTTSDELNTGMQTMLTVANCIREAKEIPARQLESRMMEKGMSLGECLKTIDELVSIDVIEVRGPVIHWIKCGTFTVPSVRKNPIGAPIPWRMIRDGERLTPLHYAAVRSDGLSFMNCLKATAGTMELVKQFDRLHGSSFSKRPLPINAMIDKATGKKDADMQAFLRFVWNSVFLLMPPVEKSR